MQLENPQPFSTWELTAGDSFAVTLKQAGKLMNEILEKKFARLRGGIILVGQRALVFEDTEDGVKAKSQWDKIKEELSRVFEGHFPDLMKRLLPLLAENMPHHQHFINMLYEMLLNAVEHGSGFCEIGNVLVDVRIAVNGVLATITQPVKGPDLKLLAQAALEDEAVTCLRLLEQSEKTGRGHGLLDATFDFYPLLGFEDLGENGARAVILETRERVLEIDEAMRRKVEERDRELYEKCGKRPELDFLVRTRDSGKK